MRHLVIGETFISRACDSKLIKRIENPAVKYSLRVAHVLLTLSSTYRRGFLDTVTILQDEIVREFVHLSVLTIF